MIWLMFIFTSKYSLNSICQSNKKNQSFYKPLTLIIIVLFSQLQDMFKNISSFIKKTYRKAQTFRFMWLFNDHRHHTFKRLHYCYIKNDNVNYSNWFAFIKRKYKLWTAKLKKFTGIWTWMVREQIFSLALRASQDLINDQPNSYPVEPFNFL